MEKFKDITVSNELDIKIYEELKSKPISKFDEGVNWKSKLILWLKNKHSIKIQI